MHELVCGLSHDATGARGLIVTLGLQAPSHTVLRRCMMWWNLQCWALSDKAVVWWVYAKRATRATMKIRTWTVLPII
jgi:hypothetical protein